jgi:hypothetical protein
MENRLWKEESVAMADENPKTPPKKSKPLTKPKRPSRGYRKYLRRRKAAARNPSAGNG